MVSTASRRRTAGIALFAFLAALLLPVLIHAFAPARAPIAFDLEWCLASGAHSADVTVVVTGDPSAADPADPTRPGARVAHCALCVVAGAVFAPPPDATVWRLQPASGGPLAASVAFDAPPTSDWPPAHPRGPPRAA